MRVLLISLCVAVWATALGACSVVDHAGGDTVLAMNAKWVLLPIANHTDTPQAGLRAEAIAETLLRARGLQTLTHYPPEINPDALFEPAERKVQQDAQKWARDQGARYALSGSVDEWRYKVGVDGEPAVGMMLQVVDLQSGNVVWSAVGGKSGWSRESLAVVAQKLMRELLASATLK